MQVRYRFTNAEWQEARRLARQVGRPGIGTATMWICIVAPALGSVSELLHGARSAGGIRGSVLPLLVLMACVTATLVITVRRRMQRSRFPAPASEWETVLREDGLHRRKLPDGAPHRIEWDRFTDIRVGSHVLVLVRTSGYEAIPLTALDPEQGDRLKRFISRKVRSVRSATAEIPEPARIAAELTPSLAVISKVAAEAQAESEEQTLTNKEQTPATAPQPAASLPPPATGQ